MSAVMMCDSCGEMFSVNQAGWRSFEEKWNGDPSTHAIYNNTHNHGMITRHVGPCCAMSNQTIRPRLAIDKS